MKEEIVLCGGSQGIPSVGNGPQEVGTSISAGEARTCCKALRSDGVCNIALIPGSPCRRLFTSTQGLDTGDMGNINGIRIAEIIFTSNGVSATEIAELLGIQKSAVSKHIQKIADYFKCDGTYQLYEEEGSSTPLGGRRPLLLRLIPN